MEKQEVRGLISLIVLVILLIFPIITADVISINSGGGNTSVITSDRYIEGFFFGVRGPNRPPQIIHVYNESMTDVSSGLNQGPFATSVIINFTVYEPNEVSDLNDSSAKVNLTKNGEDIRENTTCLRYESSKYYANYTCNITMWWWDAAGVWDITATIYDVGSNFTKNDSTDFQVGSTTGFEVSPVLLTWSGIVAGATNQTSNNDPITMNNTGNNEITIGNIQINATNLYGEQDDTKALWANNFSVSWEGNTGTCSGASCVECGGTNMSSGFYTNITIANLTRGNFTVNDNRTGQEQLFFCLRKTEIGMKSQAYSTAKGGAWTIRILLALIIPASRRKKKKRKISKEDRLVEAYSLILEELKEEYSPSKKELLNTIIGELRIKYHLGKKEILGMLKGKETPEIPITIFSDKFGALESVVRYLKENLNMNYHEISKELKRDERTIWTAYRKVTEKQRETIKYEKTRIMIPLSIFGNNKLTILESVIIYLRGKNMKYTEISQLLQRDQRNIWTIYSRAVKKLL